MCQKSVLDFLPFTAISEGKHIDYPATIEKSTVDGFIRCLQTYHVFSFIITILFLNFLGTSWKRLLVYYTPCFTLPLVYYSIYLLVYYRLYPLL